MPEVLSKYNRGVMATPCPTCGASQNQRCRPASGRSIARPMEPHVARVAASQGATLSRDTLVTNVAMLPKQVRETLTRSGVVTLGDLASHTWEGLMDMRNFGMKSLAWCIVILEHAGTELREYPGIDWRHPANCEAGKETTAGRWCSDLYPCWRLSVQKFVEVIRETYPAPKAGA